MREAEEIGGAEDAAGRNKKKFKKGKGKGKGKGSAAFEVVPQDSGGGDEAARNVGRQPPKKKAAAASAKVRAQRLFAWLLVVLGLACMP